MFQPSFGANIIPHGGDAAPSQWQGCMTMQQQPFVADASAGASAFLTSASLLNGLAQAVRSPNYVSPQPQPPHALNQDMEMPPMAMAMGQSVTLGNTFMASSTSQQLFYLAPPQQQLQHPSQQQRQNHVLMMNPPTMMATSAVPTVQQQFWQPVAPASTYHPYLVSGSGLAVPSNNAIRVANIVGQGSTTVPMKRSEVTTVDSGLFSPSQPAIAVLPVFQARATLKPSFAEFQQQVNQELAFASAETPPTTKSPRRRSVDSTDLSVAPHHQQPKKRHLGDDKPAESRKHVRKQTENGEARSSGSQNNIKISLAGWDQEVVELRERQHPHKDSSNSNSSPGSSVSQKQSSYGRSGEHQLKIDFISFGEFPPGRSIQRFGRCRNVIPHKLSGRFEIYGEPWEFQILYACPNSTVGDDAEDSASDGSHKEDEKVIPLLVRLTNRESGQVTQKMETYQQAAIRQSAGPPQICSDVVQEAFSTRAKDIEAQMLKTAEQRSRGTFVERRSLLKQQTAVRRLRERKGKDGHLLFGLTHEKVQTFWSKARNPDVF